MFRMLLVFLIASGLIHVSIMVWQSLTGKERWNFVKTLFYSMGIGTLAVAILTAIVILF